MFKHTQKFNFNFLENRLVYLDGGEVCDPEAYCPPEKDELRDAFDKVHEKAGANVLDHLEIFMDAPWIAKELPKIAGKYPQKMAQNVWRIADQPYANDVVKAMAKATNYTELVLSEMERSIRNIDHKDNLITFAGSLVKAGKKAEVKMDLKKIEAKFRSKVEEHIQSSNDFALLPRWMEEMEEAGMTLDKEDLARKVNAKILDYIDKNTIGTYSLGYLQEAIANAQEAGIEIDMVAISQRVNSKLIEYIGKEVLGVYPLGYLKDSMDNAKRAGVSLDMELINSKVNERILKYVEEEKSGSYPFLGLGDIIGNSRRAGIAIDMQRVTAKVQEVYAVLPSDYSKKEARDNIRRAGIKIKE